MIKDGLQGPIGPFDREFAHSLMVIIRVETINRFGPFLMRENARREPITPITDEQRIKDDINIARPLKYSQINRLLARKTACHEGPVVTEDQQVD